MAEVRVYPDAPSLARAAAQEFVRLATEAMADHGWFAVALSGGSTPRATHTLLAWAEFAGQVDWSRVHVFWGDERCVPPDHPDSNYRMARETLLDHVPIPAGNAHRMRGEVEPQQAAAEYEDELRAFFGPIGGEGQLPRFDLILLGLGEDGHTASLFPSTWPVHEGRRWVVAHYVEKLKAWRITMTPTLINAAANVVFLVAGAGKAEALHAVLEGPHQPDALPAQVVRPTRGRLLWLVDAAAAARLRERAPGRRATRRMDRSAEAGSERLTLIFDGR
jgi:6-phosphogluconolactonase